MIPVLPILQNVNNISAIVYRIIFDVLLLCNILLFFSFFKKIRKGYYPVRQLLIIFNTASSNYLNNLLLFTKVILFYIIVTFHLCFIYNNLELPNLLPELIFFVFPFIIICVNEVFKPQSVDLHDSTYCDDAPVILSKTDSNYSYVNSIKNVISRLNNNPGYFSIGLNGKWGIGKTSILETIKNHYIQKDESLHYRVIWIDAWKLKDTAGILRDVEKQLINIIKESFITVPNDIYMYFDKIIELYNHKPVKIVYDFFQLLSNNDFLKHFEITNEIIRKAVRHQGLDKIVIIFDDIDRIIEKNECHYLLKTIRYTTSFNHCVSIVIRHL